MPLRAWSGNALLKQANGQRSTGLHDGQTSELLNSRITLNSWMALVDVPVECGALPSHPDHTGEAVPERIDIIGINLADLVREENRSYLFDHWPELLWAPRLTVPLRVDYLQLLETAHQTEVGQAINYPALTGDKPDAQPAGGDRQHSQKH
ncbi:MAG: hypothetical protein K2X97_07270 [Mycobacteriaceae bacterium]|nr:hypothetical protein [Mycobacteriaceae bacterium]